VLSYLQFVQQADEQRRRRTTIVAIRSGPDGSSAR
jgi:hypothetical protein